MAKNEYTKTNNSERNSQGNNSKANNDKKNAPVLVITYLVVLLFLVMIGSIIKYVAFDAETTIANSYNHREELYAKKVVKGDVMSSDGEVLAETIVSDDGTETRYYPYKNMFAHVVGYDSNGQFGVEMLSTYYLLTSNENIIKRGYNALADKKSQGNNVVTTLNFNIQQTAYNALGYNDGAVILMEPKTGKILASVSKPDFDPNNITNVLVETQGTDSSCLLNRVTQGKYPPGSTFKVLTALEYIRENKDYEDYSYTCKGQDVYEGVSIHCYNYKVHGNLNLKDSLSYSCNNSFSYIGLTLNKGSFKKLCEDFLFNKELPYEGYYNKSEFKINELSNDSEMPQTAIGQGDTLITPLHNAMIMSTIANGGVMMKPYVIDRIESADGHLVKQFKPSTYGKIISAKEASEVSEMLEGVTKYGTACDYFYGTSYDVIGKTGTAEFNGNGDSHSWFVGYSNPDDPDVVVCVIIENASSTGTSASYVARQVLDSYYNNK